MTVSNRGFHDNRGNPSVAEVNADVDNIFTFNNNAGLVLYNESWTCVLGLVTFNYNHPDVCDKEEETHGDKGYRKTEQTRKMEFQEIRYTNMNCFVERVTSK